VIGAGGDGTLRVLAIVDLSRTDADPVVENAVSLAARLHAELSLLSVVARRLYERGVRCVWPRSSFGRTCPEIDVHRVVMPGPASKALGGDPGISRIASFCSRYLTSSFPSADSYTVTFVFTGA
jgi:hypothetical protein